MRECCCCAHLKMMILQKSFRCFPSEEIVAFVLVKIPSTFEDFMPSDNTTSNSYCHMFFFHFRCTSGATFNPVCDPDASKEPHVYVYMPSTYHLSVVLQLTFINYRLNSLEM